MTVPYLANSLDSGNLPLDQAVSIHQPSVADQVQTWALAIFRLAEANLPLFGSANSLWTCRLALLQLLKPQTPNSMLQTHKHIQTRFGTGWQSCCFTRARSSLRQMSTCLWKQVWNSLAILLLHACQISFLAKCQQMSFGAKCHQMLFGGKCEHPSGGRFGTGWRSCCSAEATSPEQLRPRDEQVTSPPQHMSYSLDWLVSWFVF